MPTKKIHHVKIEGTNLVRDTNTMGISNLDYTAKNEYTMKLRMLKTQKEEMNNFKTEMYVMRNEMSEIKNLLLTLLNKG